ncbi:MAG: tetratricopeptide repeat protein, partial [Candidatus Obscuribacterales bacterium]|nr:tetratricopeptide repeat protein [Candidatus Obscuribacterales bacterium]
MDLAEIDEEFRRLRKLIDEGTAHFEARAFEEAQNVLFQALKQMDAMRMPPSSEKVECLEKLADAYYAQKRFIESRAVYQQLKATIEEYELIEPEDNSRILFKLARSTDQVQDFENASDIFAQALEEGESCMQPGDPLLTEIYEAYSSLLRIARLDPDQLTQLERKARASRQKQAGISESLFDPVGEEKRRKRQEEEEAYYQSLSRPHKLIHLARMHPWSALAIFFSPVMVAAFALVLVASLALLGIDIGIVPTLNKEDVYSTPDGVLKIIVESPTSGQIKSSKTFPIKIRNLNRWSELISSMHQVRGQYWLKRTPHQLIGEDGICFYRSDSALLKVRQAMQQLV